jgi:UDP-N-acetylmuramoyl-L-alanyl-D-glutamate--2,6-diaminopimelate ligase
MYEGKTIVAIGVGGSGLYYISLFLLYCGAAFYGYEIQHSEETKTLESLGGNITHHNPILPLEPSPDIVIYSSALPSHMIKKIKHMDCPTFESGFFYSKIIREYEDAKLSNREKHAFQKATIAPLFKINTRRRTFIAVTGTDGKTTTCAMIAHILRTTGHRVGVITTISSDIDGRKIETGLHTTTPKSQEIYSIIKRMEQAKCDYIVIEATSQGLAMGRLSGLKFNTVVFTNITNDHLDYHRTWKNYLHAKALLITNHLKKNGTAVLNKGDRKSYLALSKLTTRAVTYSVNPGRNDYIAVDIKSEHQHIFFNLNVGTHSNSILVHLPMIGIYNVENCLAAIAACHSVGVPPIQSSLALRYFHSVAGRMQNIQKHPFSVFVDFAHTPHALELALKTVSAYKYTTRSKLIHVFGCAGRRDPYKRCAMGKVSAKYADLTILTAEDPRDESLQVINDAIARGWRALSDDNSLKKLIQYNNDEQNVEVRREAIQKALTLAKTGDVVIITGKGHEHSLCFGHTEYRWNDSIETKQLMSSLFKTYGI